MAETSSHLWTGAVSTELPVGVHTLYIRATDMFGRVFTSEQTDSHGAAEAIAELR